MVGIAPKIFIFRPKEYRSLKSLVQRLLLIFGKRIAFLNYDQFPRMHCELCEFFTPKGCGNMQFFPARDLYKFYDFFFSRLNQRLSKDTGKYVSFGNNSQKKISANFIKGSRKKSAFVKKSWKNASFDKTSREKTANITHDLRKTCILSKDHRKYVTFVKGSQKKSAISMRAAEET